MSTDLQLAKKVHALNQVVSQLQQDVQMLLERQKDTDNTRLEKFYQRHLEKKFNATHVKSEFGISDIENDKFIIEIKNWRHYKSTLGQLLSYSYSSKKQLIAYFFGKKPDNLTKVLDLFTQHNIEVYHIESNCDDIIEETLCQHGDSVFENWLQSNVQVSPNAKDYIDLRSIVKFVTGQDTMHSKAASIFRIKFEVALERYFNTSAKYKQFWINGEKKRGWQYFRMVTKPQD